MRPLSQLSTIRDLATGRATGVLEVANVAGELAASATDSLDLVVDRLQFFVACSSGTRGTERDDLAVECDEPWVPVERVGASLHRRSMPERRRTVKSVVASCRGTLRA